MMSATGKPLSLLPSDARDLVCITFGKLRGDLLKPSDRLEESAGPETSSDDKPANSIGEIEKSVNHLDVWRLFQENSRFKLLCCSKHNWPSLPTRQAKVGAADVSKTLTTGNRQTAENGARFHNVPSCVELTQVKSGNEHSVRAVSARPLIGAALPDNDNWHPLEAA